ncbi:MAG: hypothetical protein WCJ46_02645 [bacterium]
MKKVLFLLIVLLAGGFSSAWAETVSVEHFAMSPSVTGTSGFINNPSAYVLKNGMLGLGLHNYLLKINYGLFDVVEIGLKFDLETTSVVLDILKHGSFNCKAAFLDEKYYFVSVAAGVIGVPVNLFEKIPEKSINAYISVSKNIYDMNITAGYVMNKNMPFFVDFSKVINDTVLYVLEYDGNGYNTGFRISLNYNINIEAFVSGLEYMGKIKDFGGFLKERFIFGITYTQ